MLTETYAEVSKISIFSTVASNMNKTKIAEELMDLVPDFAKALDKVKTLDFGSNVITMSIWFRNDSNAKVFMAHMVLFSYLARLRLGTESSSS